jgi:hypothetical protein
MTRTNADIAEFRARRRNPRFAFPMPRDEPSWMAPQEDSSLMRLVIVGLAIALGVLLCLAFWARVAADLRNDSFAKERVDECTAQGMYPHIDRDAEQKVISVRCDAFEVAK